MHALGRSLNLCMTHVTLIEHKCAWLGNKFQIVHWGILAGQEEWIHAAMGRYNTGGGLECL